MDPEFADQKKAPRKVRFQPKAPVRRAPKATAPKKEEIDDAESTKANELMRRFQESLAAGKPKIEKKSEPVRVAFGYGASIAGNYNASNGDKFRYQDKAHVSKLKDAKEYKEPWNYYSYYPLTLPLRRPYSGNPNLLDEQEFGEVYAFDETMSNPAIELGLMEEGSEPRMMFLQLPMTIPAMKRAAGQASTSDSKPSSSANPMIKACGLRDLQAGAMGKMVVYKSGAVKFKLGDTLYDVTPGSDSIFSQDVVAINAKEKNCCAVGELQKRAILTPDVDSILDSLDD
uniref:DNA-directed RNA polymerase III subunit RPC4 n=1 Tax=Opuntia streptacantha TaxID=393608 RepID=A0A7C9DF58_OPUST